MCVRETPNYHIVLNQVSALKGGGRNLIILIIDLLDSSSYESERHKLPGGKNYPDHTEGSSI